LFALQNTFFECLVLDVPSALTPAPHALVRDAVAPGAISPGHLDLHIWLLRARVAVMFGDEFTGEYAGICEEENGERPPSSPG
jgi:hypothetical protein